MPLKVPASLVRHLNEKRCVIFVGAGLSAQAKLPSWGQLLSDLVNQVGADEQDEDGTAELKKLLDAGRYLDVADECKERLGAGYAEFLSKALQVGADRVPEAHQLVMQLPFAAWITTNYDKLLEQAYFKFRGNVPKTLTHLDADAFGTLLFDGAPFILKAHGDIDKPDSLIFTTRDYRELIHSNPAFQAIFSAILLTRAVLFVGYSLNDPDFRLLLDRQLTTFRKFVPERYAIMAGVGEVEREVLRRTAQIKVISYPAGQHEQLVEFLRMLQAQVAAATAPIPLEARDNAPVTRSPPKAKAAMEDGIGGMAPGGMVFSAPPPAAAPAPRAPPPRPAAQPAPPQSAPMADDAPATETAVASSSALPSSGQMTEKKRVRLSQLVSNTAPTPSSPSGPIVLTINTRGHQTVAVLRNRRGEITVQGTHISEPVTRPLLRGRARADVLSDQGQRLIGLLLAAQLPMTVLQALEALLEEGGDPSVILELDADSEMMPWELVYARGKPLVLQAPVSRAPVGLSSEARGRPMFRKPVRALLVGDPTEELPGTREEIERLTELYPTATVLMGGEATLDRVTDLFGGTTEFDVVHFVGHAWYDAQDVCLDLANGALTDDLIRAGLSHTPPSVFFLNSHYTAFVPPGVRAKGSEPMKATAAGRMGFTEVAMRSGVGAFIGCFGSCTEQGARAIAVEFHRALLSGVPAAQALYRARTQAKLPADDPSPLLYSLSGYGDLTLE